MIRSMDALETMKVTLVGDGSVGKTSLLIRFIDNIFPDRYEPTVFDEKSATVLVKGQRVRLSIWDTAGQEDFDKLRAMAYPQTDLFVVCFACNDPLSFENIGLKWIPEIRANYPETPLMLLATKIDLRADPVTIEELKLRKLKPISHRKGYMMHKEIQAKYYVECSSKSSHNVVKVFELAASFHFGNLRRRYAGFKYNCCLGELD